MCIRDSFFRVSQKFKFNDHQPPPFVYINDFCRDVERFLAKTPDNVVAIHCKAGKGRTGVMICCYLIYSQACKTALEAQLYYGAIRTSDSKGVTIPSQIRYIYYYEHFLKNQRNVNIERPIPYKTVV